jgi:hypothetical protein
VTLNSLSRDLDRVVRLSNTIRIAGRVLKGYPESDLKAVRNKAAYLGAMARFLR